MQLTDDTLPVRRSRHIAAKNQNKIIKIFVFKTNIGCFTCMLQMYKLKLILIIKKQPEMKSDVLDNFVRKLDLINKL